jgi:flagellar basal-body rod protein FlgG
MIRALYTAASGMSAQQMNLDTIANNLANSSTTGFRQLRLQFQDMVYQNLVTPGAAQSQNTVSAGLQIGLGTKSAATEVIMTQGAEPDRQSARCGHRGQRVLPGAAARRHHRLHPRRAVSAEQPGNDCDHGRRPDDSHHHHSANATAVTITQYGVVNATLAGQQNPSQLGQIQLATFPNPGGLESMGSNLLTGHAQLRRSGAGQSRRDRGMGTLQQGYLENSNVDVVTMFVQMVLAQRAYESNSKVIKAADDMYSQVNNMTPTSSGCARSRRRRCGRRARSGARGPAGAAGHRRQGLPAARRGFDCGDGEPGRLDRRPGEELARLECQLRADLAVWRAQGSNALQNLVGMTASSGLTAQGQSTTNSSLATTFGGEVVDVLPNGMLVVQATRQLTFSQQTQLIKLRGLVRPEDVSAQNQVLSTAMTDLELEVTGKGIVNDSTYRQNPLVRFWRSCWCSKGRE